jgi:hypothetical protein
LDRQRGTSSPQLSDGSDEGVQESAPQPAPRSRPKSRVSTPVGGQTGWIWGPELIAGPEVWHHQKFPTSHKSRDGWNQKWEWNLHVPDHSECLPRLERFGPQDKEVVLGTFFFFKEII